MRPSTVRYVQRLTLGLGIVLVSLLLAGGFWKLPVMDRLDAMLYDMRLRATMPERLDERIVIIDIDETSLAEVGRWPWSRDRLAELVRVLFEEQGVTALGFDVVFAEPDDSGGLNTLQTLADDALKNNSDFQQAWQALRGSLDHDGQFARALQGRPAVLGYYLTSDREGFRAGELPPPTIDLAASGTRVFEATRWTGYGGNIPVLAQAASGAGFFNPIVDVDGVVRSVPLLARLDDGYRSSLALELYAALFTDPRLGVQFPQDPFVEDHPYISHVTLSHDNGDTQYIAVDQRAAVMVPFRGRGGPDGGSYTYFSAADVLAGRLPPGMLGGTIALVGTTAPGLLDLRATPVSEVYPGVEVHANVLSGLLDGQLPVRPDYATGADMAIIAVSGVALAALLPVLGAWSTLGVAGMTLAGLAGLNTWLMTQHALVLPLAGGLLCVALLALFNTLYGYLVESRSKRHLAQLFGSYVPPELVQEMVKEPERYSMRAESKVLTVMFSDMRGFTALSERLAPEDLQRLLNRLFNRLSQVIRQHGGTIDKFMGDCIMAFWGAPVDTPNHARKAVQAALAMNRVMDEINAEHQREGLPPIGMGFGINTGPMLVGDMGSDLRRSYTVIGDAVNLASRLEGLGKTYHASVIVSESTREQAGDDWTWQELDQVVVKGKTQPVRIFTPRPL